MSRFPADKPPEPKMPTAEEIVTFWKNGKLPDELRDDELGLLEPTAKKMASVERSLQEYVSREKVNATLAERLQDGSESLNNFYLSFFPRANQDLMNGQWELLNGYALRPFAINHLYDGTWNAMCEELANEVRVVINFLATGKPGGDIARNPEVLQAIQQLALYLHAKKVPLSYLMA